MNNIEYRAPLNSDEFEKYDLFRWRILRKPIGKSIDSLKDKYENSKTLKFLSDSENVIFVDVSDTNCKKKLTTGGWHGITLTKCFADEDPRSKEIIKYLNKIY